MKLIRGLHNLKPFATGCVATIGNFDGVHLGHQAIIDQLQAVSVSFGLPTVVMIFEPQPREFFSESDAPPRLMRFSDKLEALRQQQVDCVVCLQFNHRLRSLTGPAFIEQVLIRGLRIRHLVVGDDFHFGCDRSGDFKLLQSFGERSNYTVSHTSTLVVEGERVSSTRIRSVLMSGDFAQAERLLGRPYCVSGRVMYGKQLGRQLGVPTANINPGRKKPVLSGVFAVITRLVNGNEYQGVANIGLRPSIDSTTLLPVLEVHLLDFDEDLYGQRVAVRFLNKIREECKFAGLDALKQQIQKDIQQARAFFRL